VLEITGKKIPFWFECYNNFKMLVIGSEGGRFPVGLILASAFWMACFGFFIQGLSKDSQTCSTISTNEFPSAIPIIDGSLQDLSTI
jgi:hypothetical protein